MENLSAAIVDAMFFVKSRMGLGINAMLAKLNTLEKRLNEADD